MQGKSESDMGPRDAGGGEGTLTTRLRRTNWSANFWISLFSANTFFKAVIEEDEEKRVLEHLSRFWLEPLLSVVF